jgi:Domain of unknown function (DUF4908)
MRLRVFWNAIFIGAALLTAPFCIAQSREESAAFRALVTPKNSQREYGARHYEAENGINFSLERMNGNNYLFKYDNNDEVFVLNSNYGARGDEFLRNDIGETILRITSLGGITFYGRGDENGKPASAKGKAQNIARLENTYSPLQPLTDNALDKFDEIGLNVENLEIDANLPTPLVKDTIARLYETLRSNRNIYQARKIKRIRISRAAQIFIFVNRQNIEIGITPGIGYSGRPSSRAIQKAITQK